MYCLINNKQSQKVKGVLADEVIKTALKIGVEQHIDQHGQMVDESKSKERITYHEEDVQIFKDILVNYKFALVYDKLHKEIVLPLASPLDESKSCGEFLAMQGNDYQKMEIMFKLLPADLFFQLITHTKQHLDSIDDLWRTGVVLNYFTGKTKALLQVQNNTLSISTTGDMAVDFLQLLVHYLKAVLHPYGKSYKTPTCIASIDLTH